MDWTKPTAQILGRFNPWNDGHKALFDEVLRKADPDRQPKHREPTSDAHQVCIMVRDMGLGNFEEIKEAINDDMYLEYYGRYEIIQVPNITNIFYGRKVGFDVDRVNLPNELESVNETQDTKAERNAWENKFWRNRQ